MRIAINGFGRIGRLALRRLADVSDVEVVGINDLADPGSLSYLFRYDSVHGRTTASLEDGALHYAGRRIPFTQERNPEDLKWGEKGIDVVIEATGVFTRRQGAQRHLDSGARKVLITAPAVEPDRTIVLGVNDDQLLDSDRIVSNASCTTNCIAPVSHVLNTTFGIVNLAFTTIHAYTSTQALVDVPASKYRRGRAAAMSMIPTTTGASKAIGKVIPELEGKAQGMAIRVPTPDGSVTDMVVRLSNPPADVAGLLQPMREAAANRMGGVLEVSDDPLVSADIIGNPHSSIVDVLSASQVSEDTFKLLAWYDNEYGYASRVADLVQILGR